MSLNSIELFAGAGGLALGVALAGFKTRAVVEWDQWACDTIRENQGRGHPLSLGGQSSRATCAIGFATLA